MGANARKRTRSIFAALVIVSILSTLAVAYDAGPSTAAPVSWEWKDTRGPGTGCALDIAYDSSRDITYMASGTERLWRHDAGGWSDIRFPTDDVSDLAYDSVRNILYVGAGEGVWRCTSPNGSPSYTRTVAFDDGYCTDLVYDQAHNVLYAAGGKIRRCDRPDGALRWTPIGSGWQVALAYDPVHDVLYGGRWGCERCDNPRSNPAWTDIGGGFGDATSLSYDTVHGFLFMTSTPSSPQVGGVYRASNPRSSVTWTKIGDTKYSSAIAYDPARDTVYASGKGVARCVGHEAASPTWTDLGGDLAKDKTYSLLCDMATNVLLTGSAHLGVRRCASPDTAPTWTDTGYAFGTTAGFFAYDSARDILYAGGWRLWRCDNPRSTPIWTDITANIDDETAFDIDGIAYDGVHNVLYAGAGITNNAGNGAWRSGNPDAAPAWAKMGDGDFGELIYDSRYDVLYGIQDFGLSRCNHPSVSSVWTPICTVDENLGQPVQDIAFDTRRNFLYFVDEYVVEETTPNSRWPFFEYYHEVVKAENPQGEAALSQRIDKYGDPIALDVSRDILYATDGYTGDILGAPGFDDPHQMCVDETRNVLYASNRGVWRCVNPGANKTWAPTGGAIANSYVGSIMYDKDHRVMYASTTRGVWYATPTPTPVITSIDPASGYPGQHMTLGIEGLETNFIKGQSHARFSSPDIHVNSTTVLSATAAVADITISPDAKQQVSEVTVITGGEEPVSVYGGFSIFSKYSFAEGTCRPGFDTYVCLSGRGRAQLDLYTASGENRSTGEFYVGDRTTVNCADVIGRGDDAAHDFSIVVYALDDQPMVVERSMYFDYKGMTGGDATMSATPASAFYFAEGTCRPGFDPFICLFNPGEQKTDVQLTYMLGDGSNVDQVVAVEPGRRATVRVKDRLGEGDDAAHDFSTKVTTSGGGVVLAERPTYFNYKGVWTGGHCVSGATAPHETLWFAEGSCRPGFDPYVTVQNPGEKEASVEVTYLKGDGESIAQNVLVGARTRSTVHPSDLLGSADDAAHDFSIKLECTNGQQIVAERPMYFSYRGWDGGHDVVGTPTPAPYAVFAEGTSRPGFDAYVSILNPNGKPVTVSVAYDRGAGGSLWEYIDIPAESRATLHPADVVGQGDDVEHDFGVKVRSNGQPLVVERPMYFNYKGLTGGSDVIGTPQPW